MRIHPLFNLIRGNLIHVTSLSAYRQIRADRFIKPNDGSFRFTYPQSSSSRAYYLKAISLFDFTLPDDKIFGSDPLF